MAALDFPTPPWTNGQVYQNYVYSTTTGAWLSKPLTGPKSTYGPTPPANPGAGDEWVNSNDMTAYGWYVDTDGGQWVEKTAPISANGYYSPNYVINGGFDIWQRGTSQTVSGYGSADRWSNVTSGTTTISQETSDLPSVAGIRYGIKFVTGAVSSFGQFFTALESANVAPLRGKVVTLSAYVKVAGSYAGNWQMKIFTSNAVDTPLSSITTQIGTTQNIATASTTSWTRVSCTVTIPSDAVGLKIEFSPDTVQPSGVTLRMAGVQLEEGSVATPFRRNANSIQAELAACQRYCYEPHGGYYLAASTFGDVVIATSATQCNATVSFPVTMRAKPSMTIAAGSDQFRLGYPGTFVISSVTFNDASRQQAVLTVASSGLTTGIGYRFYLNADRAVPQLLFSAEL